MSINSYSNAGFDVFVVALRDDKDLLDMFFFFSRLLVGGV